MRRPRPSTLAAASLLATVALLAALAPLLPLPDPAAMDPARGHAAPRIAWEPGDPGAAPTASGLPALRRVLFGDAVLAGLLGRDALGRDLAARLVWGGRVSLLVGFLATLVAALIGVPWGLLAGWCGGRLDGLLMRLVDVLYAVPFLFVVILLVGVLRGVDAGSAPDRLVVLLLVIGATSWLTMARMVRAQVHAVRGAEHVVAAVALGAAPLHIVLRHVLPQVRGLIIVVLTLTVPRVMLFEAFLSFLGLGVEPPGVSWGVLASEGTEQLTVVGTAWWLVLFPGLALTVTLAALNHLGDALRDALDPRLR